MAQLTDQRETKKRSRWVTAKARFFCSIYEVDETFNNRLVFERGLPNIITSPTSC